MPLQIIGEAPWLGGSPAGFRKGIATIFPLWNTLVTLPGIHASHRLAFVQHLNEQRAKNCQPPLGPAEEERAWARSVDLFLEPDAILIRPDPDNMELVFEADELLQTLVSKPQIRFLQATNERVRQAIKARGECWRISPLPRSPEEIRHMILATRTAIAGESIYYHNRLTGTRFLTCEALARLGQLPAAALAAHLQEIREYSRRENRLHYPEIAFFGSSGAFEPEAFGAADYPAMEAGEVAAAHEALAARFRAAVPADLRYDDPENPAWRNAMFAALVGERNEKVSDEILRGLSPEYFLQIEWLPGGRIENGELLFDPVFDELEKQPDRPDLAAICDTRVKSFVFNFIREYGELEYVNVGRLPLSLSRRAGGSEQRGVYLAELKTRQEFRPLVRVIRMQKWDVMGRLDQGSDLLGAMVESAEYSDYVLDRRLACRQLGMNLPPRIMVQKLSEVYAGANAQYRGQTVWSTYFERDYFSGMATDKIAPAKLENAAYALRLAQLLGKAAAPNLIVGRLNLQGQVLFDDGDEIVVEEQNLPQEIIVADPTGAFTDYLSPLDHFAREYALPANKRWRWLGHQGDFVAAYLGAFAEAFSSIQEEYRRRRRAFDSLFRHRKRDSRGSFAYRWEKVLERLDRTDAQALVASLRGNLPNGTAVSH